MDIEAIAAVAHEANRAYDRAIGGGMNQVPWDEAPEWQKQSVIKGVEFTLNNPDCSPEDSHNSWLEHKRAEGWTYGPVKDADKKQHPCFLPYHELPLEQRVKDDLFQGVVRALLFHKKG